MDKVCCQKTFIFTKEIHKVGPRIKLTHEITQHDFPIIPILESDMPRQNEFDCNCRGYAQCGAF